jgi:hypothetical protein
MPLLDLLVDLSNAGNAAEGGHACDRFNDRQRMAETPGEIATALLRGCVGSDGAPVLRPGEYVELVDGRLVTRQVN